jgi:DNA topoisomerase-2
MLKDMNRLLMKFSNQARFVKMIINKELVVSGKKRVDIIKDLLQKKFDKISKKDLDKAGETEETVEGEDDDAAGGDGYNYLLGVCSLFARFLYALERVC